MSMNNLYYNINHKTKIKQRERMGKRERLLPSLGGTIYFNLAAYENLLVDAKHKRTMIKLRTSLIFMTSCLKSRRLASYLCLFFLAKSAWVFIGRLHFIGGSYKKDSLNTN